MMEVIGNEDFIKIVNMSKDWKPFPHTLLYGPSGSGKSTLGKYITTVVGERCDSTYAPDLDKMLLSLMLQGLSENQLIVIDEIHALKRGLKDMIYQPLEECKFQGQPLQPFTLIGITTDLNSLTDALVRRFRLVYRVSLYDVDQLMQVLLAMTTREIQDDAAEAIAQISRGSPGAARNHLQLIETMFPGDLDYEQVKEYRDLRHIDPIGLEEVDLEYMKILSRHDALSLSTLSSMLSEREDTIEDKIEPFLFRLGFAIKSSKGRVMTPQGKSYIRTSK